MIEKLQLSFVNPKYIANTSWTNKNNIFFAADRDQLVPSIKMMAKIDTASKYGNN